MDELQILYEELEKKEEKLNYIKYRGDATNLVKEISKEISVLRSHIRLMEFEQDVEWQQWIEDSIVECKNEYEKESFNRCLDRFRKILGLNQENTYIASLEPSTKTTELISNFNRSARDFLVLNDLWEMDVAEHVNLILSRDWNDSLGSRFNYLNMTQLKNNVKKKSWNSQYKYMRIFDKLRDSSFDYEKENLDYDIYCLLKVIQEAVDNDLFIKSESDQYGKRIAFYNSFYLKAQDVLDRDYGFGMTTNSLYIIGVIITDSSYILI